MGAAVWAGLAFVAGLSLGIVVTRNLHRNPKKPFWNERVGSTSFRRANIPVGGTLGALLAGALFAAGHPEGATIAAGLALGMAAGAIGVGVVDPLRV